MILLANKDSRLALWAGLAVETNPYGTRCIHLDDKRYRPDGDRMDW